MAGENWIKERAEFAQRTAFEIFGRHISLDALEGEPPEAAELRAQMFSQAYADSWTRSALTPQMRSLLTVAMMAALGNVEEMKTHVAAGIALGTTPEQYVDLFSHVAAYCGTVRAVPGWNAASEVIIRVAKSRARKAGAAG